MAPEYALKYARINFRKHPELYEIGRGEQGVLIAEPYKSEILPLWRFRTPAMARKSAAAIYRKFLAYKASRDFVGMDMARKYLQMGFTRARRYANHRSGRKFRPGTRQRLPDRPDPLKAQSAQIFLAKWKQARSDRTYLRLMAAHRARQAADQGKRSRSRNQDMASTSIGRRKRAPPGKS